MELCHRCKVRLHPLYVASQFRDGNLNEFFSHENQPRPPPLSVRGKLKLGTKSDIVRCLEDAPEEQDDTGVDVVVLDGLAILYVLKAAATGTFCESCLLDMFLPYVYHQLGRPYRTQN